MNETMLTASLLLLGAVLVVMALAEPLVRRLPLSPALVYLLSGWLAASLATPPLPALDLQRHAGLLRVASEIAVLLSLFAVGLKIRIAASWSAWKVPLLLASSAMLWSVGLATLAAWLILPLSSWAMAFLLAAILAPTDPVLASDVQIRSNEDRDGLRLALSAEGALNDGTAMPVVLLALGLLGLHELGPRGMDWLLGDLLWAVVGGTVLGVACGRGLGWALRRRLRAGVQADWDELLYLGAIGLTYGLAQAVHASAFLAVFAAGATLLRQHPAARPDPEALPLGEQLQAFGARCERLVEVLMVLLIGAALSEVRWSAALLLFALAMLLLVRPLSVLLGLPPRALPAPQQRLVAWFGIRGVGSVLYLAMALEQGLAAEDAQLLVSACLVCIALSIGLHGVSATPLMEAYQRRQAERLATGIKRPP
ncbi:cation:proton antiporter [Roseateles violae]|uniref:Cation:proton antiporter n=1 Tax=Roseateles violae TaxID=3058042 RepID=A0ABT8DQP0_9BURK|nr:cation:proton antiporter [Pelomonas sp. PFR6]MDN3920665.1 cation:proton antiporter [Pelomonas sp. PFR6]